MTLGCSTLPPSLGFLFTVATLPSLTFHAHHCTAPLRHLAQLTNAGNGINPQPDTQLRNLENKLCSATAPGQTRGSEKYKATCLSCGLPSSCRPPLPSPINKGGEGQRTGVGSSGMGIALLLPLLSWCKTPPK